MIVLGSRGFNFKTSVHLSNLGSSSQRCCVKVKSRDDFGGGSSFAYSAWGPIRGDHARRHNFKERKETIASIKIKLTMKV
jgi:hypothetical protein